MRAIKYITLLLISMLAIAGCRRVTPDPGHEEISKLNTLVLEKAINEPDSAFMMIDSLRTSGILPDYRCDFLRAKIYAQTLEDMRLDSAIIIGEKLMTLDEVKNDLALRQDVLEMLINACRQQNDDKMTIHWCTQLIDLCRQNGEETEALRNEAEIGLMLAGMGNVDEGLSKIDTVINKLSGKRKFNEMDASVIALRRKITVLNNCGHFNEIPDVAQTILDLLADFEQHPDEFHDGTYREPPEHLRDGYIDFYRSQDYSNIANAYARLGDNATARYYIDLFLQGDYAKTYNGRQHIAVTYSLLGEYSVSEAIHAEEEARFRAQEQKFEAERQRLETQRAKQSRSMIGVIGLLTLMFAIYAVIQLRKTRRRNRILAKQISETVQYKEKYKKLSVNNVDNTQLSTLSDAELFDYLRDLIEREQLFLDPNFERQTLVARTGVSKERIGAAFAQAKGYERLTTLVRELRLDYAVRLMNEHPEMAVEDIARGSGFLRADTFATSFRAKYGMTPTAYRQSNTL